MGCSAYIPPWWNDDKFSGCDGQPWDNEFLQYQLEVAVEQEQYEWAAEIRDELKRRNAEIPEGR